MPCGKVAKGGRLVSSWCLMHSTICWQAQHTRHKALTLLLVDGSVKQLALKETCFGHTSVLDLLSITIVMLPIRGML